MPGQKKAMRPTRTPSTPSAKSSHLRPPEPLMPATIAKMPSTTVYAPKKTISTKRVRPGQKSAANPKSTAAIPLKSNAHQLVVRVGSMGCGCVELIFVLSFRSDRHRGQCPTSLSGGRPSGALSVVGVLGKRVDDHHTKRDDHYREHRRSWDYKEPPDGTHDGEEIAHRPTEAPSSEEVYARVQRDDRDDQVEDAPEDEVRVEQVARFGNPPAGARKRQERAQSLQAGHNKHHDSGEGEHAGSPVRCRPGPEGALRTAADPSRDRFAVLICHYLSPFSL